MPPRSGNAVWIDVLPSMARFGVELAKQAVGGSRRAGQQMAAQLERVAKDAGKAAGEALAAGVEDAKDRVKDAAEDMTKAHEKVADAAGRVTVAEAKLADARKKFAETSSQVVTAQERLSAATRAHTAAERSATRAVAEHDQATAHLTESQKRYKDETDKTESALQRMARSLTKMDTSRIDQGSRSMAKFSAASYASAAGIAAIGTSLPAIAGLSALMVQASGSALVLPGALAAGGAAAGTLKLGLSGVGDALKQWGDAEKFAEKIEELSGNARGFAIEVRALRPELIGLRNAVQDRLFAGAADDVKALGSTYVPVLRKELADVSGEFGLARQSLASFAVEGGTVRDVTSILDLTEEQIRNVRGAIAPLVAAFLDLAVVGGGAVSSLTSGLSENAAGLAKFIANARETGQLQQWLYAGLQVLDDFGELFGNVGSIIGTVLGAANAQGGSLLATMNAVTGSVVSLLQSTQGQEALAAFFRTVHDTVDALLPGLRAVGGAVLDGVVMLGPQIPPVAQAFSDIAISLAPLIPDLVALAVSILPPIVALVRELAPAVGTLTAAWIGGYAALLAYNGAVAVMQGIQWVVSFVRAWAAGQLALNVAMTANPIGLIIAAIGALVAAVIYLWNNNEGFRNFFITAWAWIKAAIVGAWESYIKPAFAAIVTAVKAVGDAAVWLWQSAIVPAAEAIGTAASWLWHNVLEPFFSFIGLAVRIAAAVIITLFVTPAVIAFRLLAAQAMWLWENGISPAFDAIAVAARWLWTFVIQPFVAVHVAAFRMVASAALWLYEHGVKPAFDGIAMVVGWVIDAVVWYFNLWVGAVQFTWFAIQAALSAIGDFFTWLWQAKVSPIIDLVIAGAEILGHAFGLLWTGWIRPALVSFGEFLQWLWDNTIGRVFGQIREGASSLGNAFDSAVGFIERVWGRLREILAKPVNFLIQVVYNEGVRAVWNKVADFVGISGLPEMRPIAFAGGGVLSGYAPGRDIVPALLSPGEAVLVPEAVRLLGARNILALNAVASGRRGNVVGGYSGGGVAHRFAGGGVIGSIASWVGDLGQSVMDLFSDPAGFVRSRLGGGGGWIEQLALLPGKVIGQVGDFLWAKIKGWFGGGDTPAGGDQLAQWITAGMRIAGVPGSWYNPLHTLIMRESGGNPAAINLTDINAQQGHPSQGLMQTIPGTFAAYRDPRLPDVITDPVANIVAGIRYILARYGTIFNVQQAVGSTPMGYDSGGYLMPGMSTVFNGTGRPEPVLTAAQWKALGHNGSPLDTPVVITGRLDLGDGLEARIDGRISQAQQQTGAAIAARRRF